ncbi:Uma2 family endonuclease [bacterium]|nr:Uma2 family endonuclease [bacterium]
MTLPLTRENRDKVWTYEDYLQLPEDGNRYEIIEGVLYVSPTPFTVHQLLSRRLLFVFYEMERRGEGYIYNAPTGLKLDGGNPVEPDLIFLRADQRHQIKRKYILGPPHLVVEILSPGTARLDRVKKMRLYAKNRIPHYWLLDPDSKVLEVLKLGEQHYSLEATLESGDHYESPDFPGLHLDLSQLFEDMPGEDED